MIATNVGGFKHKVAYAGCAPSLDVGTYKVDDPRTRPGRLSQIECIKSGCLKVEIDGKHLAAATSEIHGHVDQSHGSPHSTLE